jgi:hypothetical protein
VVERVERRAPPGRLVVAMRVAVAPLEMALADSMKGALAGSVVREALAVRLRLSLRLARQFALRQLGCFAHSRARSASDLA